MPRGDGSRMRGLVALHGLAAQQCRRLVGRTERHDKLYLRMRLEHVALEASNARDSEPNALRVYEVLVTTGKVNVRLDVRCHDTLVVRLPGFQHAAGRGDKADEQAEEASDAEDDDDKHTASFEVLRVRAVVAGLHSSEFIHRALLEIAATSD